MSIKIVSNEVAEQAAFVVCMRKADDPGYFKDNDEGTCSHCHETVVFRPETPKKPPRICVQCMKELIAAGDPR